MAGNPNNPSKPNNPNDPKDPNNASNNPNPWLLGEDAKKAAEEWESLQQNAYLSPNYVGGDAKAIIEAYNRNIEDLPPEEQNKIAEEIREGWNNRLKDAPANDGPDKEDPGATTPDESQEGQGKEHNSGETWYYPEGEEDAEKTRKKMYDAWRENVGLKDGPDDDDKAPKKDTPNQPSRIAGMYHQPNRVEGMYENPNGDYYKEKEPDSKKDTPNQPSRIAGMYHQPNRVEGMYENPNGDYYKGDNPNKKDTPNQKGRIAGMYEVSDDPDDPNYPGPLNIVNLSKKGETTEDPDDLDAERAALKKEEEEKLKEIKELEDKLQELTSRGLVAVEADTTFDRERLATQLAEEEFINNTTKGNAGFFKRIWMNYFEKYYKTKYRKEFLAGEREIDRNGEKFDLESIMENSSKIGISRIVESVARNEMALVHEGYGESRSEADKETTEMVRKAIMRYANERGDAADEKQFTAILKEEIARIKQEGHFDDPNYVNNFFEVAENAIKIKELMRGKVSMDKVLEKFAVYNADVRDSERTEVSRDKLDKLIDKWEKSKLSRFISPETVAIATSVVSLFTKSGASRVARLLTPFGGIALSGVLAGARERRKVTNEREVMMRNMENGQEYNPDPDLDSIESRYARKRAKHEAKIAGTTYDMESASKLIDDINKAIESGDEEKIMEAYTAARVRSDYSDSEKKGLIAFSSAEKRSSERLALDIALIEAKNRIATPENKARLDEMRQALLTEITNDVDKNDADFKKVRAGMVAKKVLKTVAIGAISFIVSQEAVAALSDKQVGVLEKLGVLKTQNQVGAKETMMASLVKSNDPGIIKGIPADNESEIRNLEQRGYRKIKVADETTTMRKTYIEGDPATSPHRAKVYVKEWANNGTRAYDGNELRVAGDGGRTMTTAMYGDSYAPISGRTLNFEKLLQANRIKGFVTLNGARFEIQGIPAPNGQITFIQDGIITTTSGDVIQAVDAAGNKLYQYLEIGATFGKDASTGLTEFVPMATSVGDISGGPFRGMFQELVEEATTTPAVYNFVLPPREVIYGGIVAPDLSARVGIGNGTAPKRTPEQGGTDEPTNPPAPENKPNGDEPNNGEPNDNEPNGNEPNGNEPDNGEPNNGEPDNGQPTPAPSPDGGDTPPSSDSEPAPADNEQPDGDGEDQPDQDAELPRDRYRSVYLAAANALPREIGAERARFLLETTPRTAEEYQAFWDSLTPERQITIRRLLVFGEKGNTPEGRGLREWLVAKDIRDNSPNTQAA